jgi:deazaflavin-dependent oxidoreductase (nitroreductase family)
MTVTRTASPRDLLADMALRVVNRTHRTILALSKGRFLNSPFGMPAVELHTVGRRSGRRRSTMLAAPINEKHRIVLVASKGGDDRFPDWYRNLVAQPDVDLTVGGRTRAMRARTASAAEKAELWPRIVATYQGYAGYQRRTSRDIPVVICEPRND